MEDFFTNIIAFIIAVILILGLGGLFFWGLGNLIILVFKLNAIWTFWHGVIIQICYLVLKNIFFR